MIAQTTDEIAHFGAGVVAEAGAIRQPHAPVDWPPSAHVFGVVSGEFRALVFQVAEMAEHEPDNLGQAAAYLHGLLEREPLKSRPAWAPQRVVLGLFLLGLMNALERAQIVTKATRDAMRPAYQTDAIAAVAAAFDSVYIPPPDERPPEDSTLPETVPQEETDDLAALL